MYNKINLLLSVILIAGLVFSCVPARQFNDLKDRNLKCEEERENLKEQVKDLTVKNTELASELEQIKKQINGLISDTTVMGVSLRKITQQYDKINKLNDELLDKQKDLVRGNTTETKKILAELLAVKDDLNKKEDELKELERTLNNKRKNLEKLQAKLEGRDKELDVKNAELIELQNILNRKDSIANALKNKVIDALLGFGSDELSVEQKGAKVYVKLEEKLLFKSGSFTVNPKGQKAIRKLAKVLEQNEDINVMIEGHTDNLPYSSSGNLKDNWDLSVKRSTSVLRILLEGTTIDPQRITAAGRSEYLPVEAEDTKEARQKNRRTEIILTPKLDELLEILE